jgi:hypothetical protein
MPESAAKKRYILDYLEDELRNNGGTMKDVMQYKNFIGSLHFNANDEIFCGKIEGINDLVTFEGESVKKLKSAGLSSPTSVFSSLPSAL